VGRHEFVLRAAGGAVWVTGVEPRGRGWRLNPDARVDTGQWLQVTGLVSYDRGLVTIAGSAVAATTAPEAPPLEEEEAPPAVPLEQGEVVFSSPTEGDIDIPLMSSVRIQFSRGLAPASIEGQIRVSYVGAAAPDAPPAPPLEYQHTYDAGTRAVEIRFTEPLDRFRTIRVELLDGVKTFDGASVRPWTLTFSVGG